LAPRRPRLTGRAPPAEAASTAPLPAAGTIPVHLNHHRKLYASGQPASRRNAAGCQSEAGCGPMNRLFGIARLQPSRAAAIMRRFRVGA